MLIPFVPLRPRIIDAIYIGGIPISKEVDVVFDIDMDQTSDPDRPKWEVTVDGADFTISEVAWQNARTCRMKYGGLVDPLVNGVIKLLVQDNATHGILGGITVFPHTEQFFP